MRTPALALVLLLAACASDHSYEAGPGLSPEVRAALQAGPSGVMRLDVGRGTYQIPAGHLARERDALLGALLRAPVPTPWWADASGNPGVVRVFFEDHDQVVLHERRELLQFDSTQGRFALVRTDGIYHSELVEPEDPTHHYVVEFEPTPEVDRAWDALVHAADGVAVTGVLAESLVDAR